MTIPTSSIEQVIPIQGSMAQPAVAGRGGGAAGGGAVGI